MSRRRRLPGETPARFAIALVLRAPHLDPAAVTRAVGVAPTACVPPVRTMGFPSGSTVAAHWGGIWTLTSARRVDAADPDAHVRWLLSVLEPRLGALRASCPGVRVSFDVPFDAHLGEHPLIDPLLRRRIAALGAEITLSAVGACAERRSREDGSTDE